MKFLRFAAVAIAAAGATVAFMRRDDVKKVYDQFADRRRTLGAPA